MLLPDDERLTRELTIPLWVRPWSLEEGHLDRLDWVRRHLGTHSSSWSEMVTRYFADATTDVVFIGEAIGKEVGEAIGGDWREVPPPDPPAGYHGSGMATEFAPDGEIDKMRDFPHLCRWPGESYFGGGDRELRNRLIYDPNAARPGEAQREHDRRLTSDLMDAIRELPDDRFRPPGNPAREEGKKPEREKE